MSDLETKHCKFYRFLDSIQPYNRDYSWLRHLADYSSEKHTRLTPQTKTEKRGRITVGGSVSWTPNVIFGKGVSVMGVPIDPSTQLPVSSDLVETKIENSISFLFEGSNVNVLWLCKKSVEDGEKIIQKILEYLS